MLKTKRHRGVFDPNNSSPYELSRSRVENFVRCPACFYLRQIKKVNFPSIPGFNINEATDVFSNVTSINAGLKGYLIRF